MGRQRTDGTAKVLKDRRSPRERGRMGGSLTGRDGSIDRSIDRSKKKLRRRTPRNVLVALGDVCPVFSEVDRAKGRGRTRDARRARGTAARVDRAARAEIRRDAVASVDGAASAPRAAPRPSRASRVARRASVDPTLPERGEARRGRFKLIRGKKMPRRDAAARAARWHETHRGIRSPRASSSRRRAIRCPS